MPLPDLKLTIVTDGILLVRVFDFFHKPIQLDEPDFSAFHLLIEPVSKDIFKSKKLEIYVCKIHDIASSSKNTCDIKILPNLLKNSLKKSDFKNPKIVYKKSAENVSDLGPLMNEKFTEYFPSSKNLNFTETDCLIGHECSFFGGLEHKANTVIKTPVMTWILVYQNRTVFRILFFTLVSTFLVYIFLVILGKIYLVRELKNYPDVVHPMANFKKVPIFVEKNNNIEMATPLFKDSSEKIIDDSKPFHTFTFSKHLNILHLNMISDFYRLKLYQKARQLKAPVSATQILVQQAKKLTIEQFQINNFSSSIQLKIDEISPSVQNINFSDSQFLMKNTVVTKSENGTVLNINIASFDLLARDLCVIKQFLETNDAFGMERVREIDDITEFASCFGFSTYPRSFPMDFKNESLVEFESAKHLILKLDLSSKIELDNCDYGAKTTDSGIMFQKLFDFLILNLAISSTFKNQIYDRNPENLDSFSKKCFCQSEIPCRPFWLCEFVKEGDVRNEFRSIQRNFDASIDYCKKILDSKKRSPISLDDESSERVLKNCRILLSGNYVQYRQACM